MTADWYEKGGYTVLARNWRCRDGEIDLIVTRDRRIVFCEVKTRSSDAYGSPAASVTLVKQARIRRLAMRWLDENAVRGRSVRFDVSCVIAGRVTVIEAAF